MKDLFKFLSDTPEAVVLLFMGIVLIAGLALGAVGVTIENFTQHRERMEAIKSGYNQVYDKESGKTLWVKPTVSAEH